MGAEVGFVERSGRGSIGLLTLRFRAKVILGFAVVLALTAASMAFAYFGFERVAMAVATYRTSVSEADMARTIDRELVSYQALARYYAVTGNADDETAAAAAEAEPEGCDRQVGIRDHRIGPAGTNRQAARRIRALHQDIR